MKVQATIEIPKGCDRRIHKSFNSNEFIDLGLIVDKIPINEGIMPVDYGYINDYYNVSEGDEVDVLIFSNKSYNTGDQIEVIAFGIISREDGDHKVLAHDETFVIEKFEDLDDEYRELILEYFGYNSRITHIGGQGDVMQYLYIL